MRLVTFLIALAMAIGAIVLPVAAEAAEPPAVVATFAPAALGTLAPGQDLVLSGTISNSGAQVIPAGTATVTLNRTAVSSRTDLAGWHDSDSILGDDKLGTKIFETGTPEVPAGHSVPVVITVPAAAVSLSAQSSWGTRTVAVTVRSVGSVVAQARTDIVWAPGGPVAATGLAVAFALTVPHPTTGLIPADLLATYTGIGGILSHDLDSVIGRNVAIGIDPMLLASIRVLGDSAPQSATDWLSRLEGAPNDTFALSYADSDLAVATQAGSKRLLTPTGFPIDPTLFPGASTVSPSPQTGAPTGGPTPTPSPTGGPVSPLPTPESLVAWPYTIDKIGWPADDTVVEADLDAFDSFGLSTTILNSSNVSYTVNYTPSAAATIDKHRVVVSDNILSSLLRSAAGASSQLAWENAMVRLSGSIAVVGRERLAESRTLLTTLGRSTGIEPRLSQTLDALAALSWATPATVAAVATAGEPISASVTAKPVPAARLAQIKALLASEAQVGNFSSVLADPSLLSTERRLSLLALLSNSWSSDDSGLAAANAKYLTRSTTILNSVSIAESSSLFLTSQNSPLPVTVSNKLPWPVTVYVSVRSPTGILEVLEPRVELTIEANSQAKASVPIRSVANGEVLIDTTLSSATNIPIGRPVQTKVEVQAGWETAFTAVVAALVVGVFGFGIWRNIRKRRKGKGPAGDGEPGDESDETPAPADSAETTTS
ncbi:DUF6049 family protein [Lacisediminihabitans profunda]|uniref:DUF6049 family protein n=1 Tax=Lacisediminihabitans profunda TaxID=2594790 RepID=UPI001FE677F9|nr:DUF6049 family protein [Lacisediminihabitans profunda]